MKNLFLLFCFSFFLVSCKKETSDGTDAQVAEKTLLNVAYGSNAAQTMDVYLPANRTSSSHALVLVHGGSWSTGDKADFNEYLAVFKERLPEYALFNINYRLAALPAENLFPTQEQDVKAAMDFIVSKNSEYIFDTAKMALLGASAGAHLALLQAYKYNMPKIKAVVDMFGPTDLAELFETTNIAEFRNGIAVLLSGTPATNSAAYQSASPINFASSTSPPTLILHGGEDFLVSVAQSVALQGKLQAANVPVQLVVYPSESHGWTGPNLTDTYQKIDDFLEKYNP